MRTIIALVLILLGIVGVAGGIWGFSLDPEADVNTGLANIATDTLGTAQNLLDAMDEALAGVTGSESWATDFLNNAAGDNVDLTDDKSVADFASANALTILLFGIIGIETGLLMFKFGR